MTAYLLKLGNLPSKVTLPLALVAFEFGLNAGALQLLILLGV